MANEEWRFFFENRRQAMARDNEPYQRADLVLHGTVQYLCGRVSMRMSVRPVKKR